MPYTDWHARPGYFRDITRHFSPSDSILDVGCGTAWLAEDFQRYQGVDAMPEAVEIALAAGRDVRHADVVEGLPFDDAAFDGVILKDVLEHVEDPIAVVREVHRVLRPGGRTFVSAPDAQRWVWDDYTHRRPFTRTSMRRLLSDGGLRLERVGYESVMPGSSVVSRLMPSKRRPLPLRLAAAVGVGRRNVYALARRPDR